MLNKTPEDEANFNKLINSSKFDDPDVYFKCVNNEAFLEGKRSNKYDFVVLNFLFMDDEQK